MSIVSTRGVFENNKSRSKLPIRRKPSCSKIYFAKQKVSLSLIWVGANFTPSVGCALITQKQ